MINNQHRCNKRFLTLHKYTLLDDASAMIFIDFNLLYNLYCKTYFSYKDS